MLTMFVEHGIMAHKPWWLSQWKGLNFFAVNNNKGYKEIFQFLSYSTSVIENIHHTLTVPHPPSLAAALTVLRKRQSRFSLIPNKLFFP